MREHRSGVLKHIESVVVEGLRSATLDGIIYFRDDSRQKQLQVDRGDARQKMEEFLSAGDSTRRVSANTGAKLEILALVSIIMQRKSRESAARALLNPM